MRTRWILAAALALLLSSCSAERFARAWEFSAWTYNSDSNESALASRVTPTGGVGSQGLLESSGSGEGYGFGGTFSVDRFMGPEQQPIQRIQIVGAPPAWMLEPSGERLEWQPVPAPEPSEKKRPVVKEPNGDGFPTKRVIAAALPLLGLLAEGISRAMGKGSLVAPVAKGLMKKMRPTEE